MSAFDGVGHSHRVAVVGEFVGFELSTPVSTRHTHADPTFSTSWGSLPGGLESPRRLRSDSVYRSRFVEKGGRPVADFFLAGPNKELIASQYGILSELEHRDFAAIRKRLSPAQTG